MAKSKPTAAPKPAEPVAVAAPKPSAPAGRPPSIKLDGKCIPQDAGNADFIELCRAVQSDEIKAPAGLVIPSELLAAQ